MGAVSRQACRNHIAILAVPGRLAPLAAATGDVDAAASGNLGDDAVGRSRSLPEVDGAVDGREPAAGRLEAGGVAFAAGAGGVAAGAGGMAVAAGAAAVGDAEGVGVGDNGTAGANGAATAGGAACGVAG